MSTDGDTFIADDVELIYWAAGLMHEFVLKGKDRLLKAA
jgi:hypothetical protein